MTETVTRHWSTPLIIDSVDLAGIVHADLTDDVSAKGMAFERIQPGVVLADEQALAARMLASMTALADAEGQLCPSGVTLDVQVWRGGYDLPATAHTADYVGWCFLAAKAPKHSESGAVTVADPRAGSALIAMPGLPWGKPAMIQAVPGAHLAVPGWLTCFVTPVEEGQHAVVAVASSVR